MLTGGTEPGLTATQVMPASAATIGPKSKRQLGHRRECQIQLPEAVCPGQIVCLVQKDKLSCLLWWPSELVSQSWPWSELTAEPMERGSGEGFSLPRPMRVFITSFPGQTTPAWKPACSIWSNISFTHPDALAGPNDVRGLMWPAGQMLLPLMQGFGNMDVRTGRLFRERLKRPTSSVEVQLLG